MALLDVKNLTKRFGGLIAVNDFTFSLNEAEIVSIIGPNGAGKTTVFNCICALFPISAGTISFEGVVIATPEKQVPTHQVARLGIGRTFQIVKPLKELTVMENVMVGAFAHSNDRPYAEGEAHRILDWIGLKAYKSKRARELTLSGRKRLEVARALATRPKLLLLDEVMAGLNPTEIEDMIRLILRMRDEQGITAACGVEHVMRVVMTISDRILVLNYGRQIAEGTPKQIAADPVVIGAYLGEAFEESKA